MRAAGWSCSATRRRERRPASDRRRRRLQPATATSISPSPAVRGLGRPSALGSDGRARSAPAIDCRRVSAAQRGIASRRLQLANGDPDLVVVDAASAQVQLMAGGPGLSFVRLEPPFDAGHQRGHQPRGRRLRPCRPSRRPRVRRPALTRRPSRHIWRRRRAPAPSPPDRDDHDSADAADAWSPTDMNGDGELDLVKGSAARSSRVFYGGAGHDVPLAVLARPGSGNVDRRSRLPTSTATMISRTSIAGDAARRVDRLVLGRS